MNEILGVVIVIAWFTSAIVGAMIGAQHGKTGKGALLGFFFGPIGWIMMMFDIGIFGLAVVMVTVIIAGFFVANEVRESDRRVAAEKKAKEKQEELAEKQEERLNQEIRNEKLRLIAVEAFNALPKWDDYGRPINRELPKELQSSEQPTVTTVLRNPLDEIFPSEIDTPEERREYLQALTDARKGRPQDLSQQPRRATRDRGY